MSSWLELQPQNVRFDGNLSAEAVVLYYVLLLFIPGLVIKLVALNNKVKVFSDRALTNVLFIPYFRLLVFGILVTLVV